ncbi:MAG TPA: hypothetical protein DEF45_17025, partial [Rhodopirellula sp.]|nr:hypothetical protein [Rhodopirellula sp.]
MNASTVSVSAADTELPAFPNTELAIYQDTEIPSATNNNILSLNDDQLRYLKYFLAGGILTLLIVLICGLMRSSSTVPAVQSHYYPYPPPPQHFMSSPPPYSYPPAPPTALQPPNSEAAVETGPTNTPCPPMPHSMYYPSIPLNLSMPVAWPSPAYAAPTALAETANQAQAPAPAA